LAVSSFPPVPWRRAVPNPNPVERLSQQSLEARATHCIALGMLDPLFHRATIGIKWFLNSFWHRSKWRWQLLNIYAYRSDNVFINASVCWALDLLQLPGTVNWADLRGRNAPAVALHRHDDAGPCATA
jgi:hypothetical protein